MVSTTIRVRLCFYFLCWVFCVLVRGWFLSFPICVLRTLCTCLIPMKASRCPGTRIRYGKWATMWVLQTKPRSSARASVWASSPPSRFAASETGSHVVCAGLKITTRQRWPCISDLPTPPLPSRAGRASLIHSKLGMERRTAGTPYHWATPHPQSFSIRVYMWGVHVRCTREVRGQLAIVGSLFPLCGFWKQAHLPNEPSSKIMTSGCRQYSCFLLALCPQSRPNKLSVQRIKIK